MFISYFSADEVELSAMCRLDGAGGDFDSCSIWSDLLLLSKLLEVRSSSVIITLKGLSITWYLLNVNEKTYTP